MKHNIPFSILFVILCNCQNREYVIRDQLEMEVRNEISSYTGKLKKIQDEGKAQSLELRKKPKNKIKEALLTPLKLIIDEADNCFSENLPIINMRFKYPKWSKVIKEIKKAQKVLSEIKENKQFTNNEKISMGNFLSILKRTIVKLEEIEKRRVEETAPTGIGLRILTFFLYPVYWYRVTHKNTFKRQFGEKVYMPEYIDRYEYSGMRAIKLDKLGDKKIDEIESMLNETENSIKKICNCPDLSFGFTSLMIIATIRDNLYK